MWGPGPQARCLERQRLTQLRGASHSSWIASGFEVAARNMELHHSPSSEEACGRPVPCIGKDELVNCLAAHGATDGKTTF